MCPNLLVCLWYLIFGYVTRHNRPNISKPGIWLAGSTAASQSEAMLENPWWLTWNLTEILLSNPQTSMVVQHNTIPATVLTCSYYWCAILIAHQIVMAKHGGPCVHFSGISTCGRTSRETVSHPQRQPLPTPYKIFLYPSMLLWQIHGCNL